MEIAGTIRDYLEAHGVRYRLIPHVPADTSTRTAEVAHVSGGSFAKAVVIEDAEHCTVVVVPAHEHIHLGELRRELGSTCALATEERIRERFADCDDGSVPPFGEAYGLEVLVDQELLGRPQVYAESGGRATLLAIAGEDFQRLMAHARAGRWGHPVPPQGPHGLRRS